MYRKFFNPPLILNKKETKKKQTKDMEKVYFVLLLL